MRIVAVLLLIAASASAQRLTFGAKAGLHTIDPAGPAGRSRAYTVGPTLELRLPAGFAVEASALYRRVGVDYLYYPTYDLVTTAVSARIRGNAWEFPLVGKYYFRRGASRWQPFLGTGWSLRTIGFTLDGSVTANTDSGPQTTTYHSTTRSDLGVGALLAAGVRLRAGRLWITPEFRFTRWGAQDWTTRRNDPAFFLGVTF